MRRDLIVRAALAVTAVVVVGWLGVMERNAKLQAQGERAITKKDYALALDSLRKSQLLNLDTAPKLSRSLLLLSGPQRPAAVATIRDVVRREPDNIRAWRYLQLTVSAREPVAKRRALETIRRLDPIGARHASR